MNDELHKKQIFFTPGPSQLYPTVKKHIVTGLEDNIGSISHRSKAFEEVFRTASKSLRTLLNIPKTHRIFFISSALEAMERIIENCVAKHSFHYVNGAFSKKWYEFAGQLGKKPEKKEVVFGQGFSFENERIPKNTELICITHNETSAGVVLNPKDIYGLKKQYPNIPIAMDIVSSAPYADIDFQYIDMVFFSVQKGFGLPAGLGVLIVNDEALEKAKFLQSQGALIGSYHGFPTLQKMAEKFQTPETPNTLALYLLGKVTQDFLKKGIENIRKETDKKAEMLYDFFDAHGQFQPFIKDEKFRSSTTIEIDVQGQSDEIVKHLSKKGIIVGKGYGEFKERHIRIANFPGHGIREVERLIKICA